MEPSEHELAGIRTIAQLCFANPFGQLRVDLEARVLGAGRVRPSAWSRPLDWPKDDPILVDLQQRAEALLASAQPLLRRRKTSDGVRRAYGELALYVLFYRYENRFFEEITRANASTTLAFYEDFKRDAVELFENTTPPSWARDHDELFALLFQLRRGFHFIFHGILGRSRAVGALREAVWESVFTHDPQQYLRHLRGQMHEVSTLILGPSGTGKELVAKAIGAASFIPFNRGTKQFERDFRWTFVPLHLAAMSPTLIESELFGHAKGAFTGAVVDRVGHFEGRTRSDTVFLDEIGDLSGDVQVKLLRVLQQREFHRIGDGAPRRFGGKVVAATNKDLAQEIVHGGFREDLYYRLCGDVIRTPSLREQLVGDASELAHLVTSVATRVFGHHDAPDTERLVSRVRSCVGADYDWPGNVRELEQCVRSLLIHDRYEPKVAATETDPLGSLFAQMRQLSVPLDDVVAEYSRWAYAQTGSFERAAEVLDVDRRTVSKHAKRDVSQD